jgi:hypothetical protein
MIFMNGFKKLLVLSLVASSLIWSACNCDKVQNKRYNFNPRQDSFFMEMPPGYKNIEFQSVNGQIAKWSLNSYNSWEMGEQLKGGACPVYREYQVKSYYYSSYDQSVYDDVSFRLSSKDQPGILSTSISQSYPAYSYGQIETDLHETEKVYGSSIESSSAFEKGYVFIGDTVINGKSYKDIYELSIKKYPTARTTEIKDLYISFSRGLLAYRKTNGLVWFLK